VFARQIRNLRARFLLPQNPDDLLFREPLLLHLVRPAMGRTLIEAGGVVQGQVNPGPQERWFCSGFPIARFAGVGNDSGLIS
jgi:hypothetical protein